MSSLIERIAQEDPFAEQDARDGEALRRLREALPTGTFLSASFPDECRWLVEVLDGVHMGDLVQRGDGATIAEAADACRAALEAGR